MMHLNSVKTNLRELNFAGDVGGPNALDLTRAHFRSRYHPNSVHEHSIHGPQFSTRGTAGYILVVCDVRTVWTMSLSLPCTYD